MPLDPEARLARLARNQAGAFNRAQATTCRVSSKMLRHRERTGSIRSVDHDVWVFTSAPAGWLQDCWAASLVHPNAGLSHVTGASQLGLDVDRSRPLHVTVPLHADHRSRSVEIHRSRHHRLEIHEGLRIVRFEHLLVQLASTHPHLVEAALHSGVDQQPARLDRVFRHLSRLSRSRLPGLRGLIELATELEGDPPTQSELERRMLDVVAEVPSMPDTVRQAPAPWSPESRSVVDALVPDWSLILEADGRRFHERRAAFERDRWRDAEAAVHGLHVMRFTHRRPEDDREGVVDQLTRYGANRRRRAA